MLGKHEDLRQLQACKGKDSPVLLRIYLRVKLHLAHSTSSRVLTYGYGPLLVSGHAFTLPFPP